MQPSQSDLLLELSLDVLLCVSTSHTASLSLSLSLPYLAHSLSLPRLVHLLSLPHLAHSLSLFSFSPALVELVGCAVASSVACFKRHRSARTFQARVAVAVSSAEQPERAGIGGRAEDGVGSPAAEIVLLFLGNDFNPNRGL